MYLVPKSSDWYDGNVKRKELLAREVEYFSKLGRVRVVGDMNASWKIVMERRG